MLRKVAVKLHRWVGLVIGIFVLVVSLSGSVLVFRSEIDRALNPDLLTVPQVGAPVSLDRIVDQARTAFPDDQVRIILLPRSPNDPVEVWPVDASAPHVFVNPYSAEILGTRHETEGAMGFLFKLHADLLGGERGHKVVGTIGLLMVLLCVTGIIQWWPGRRKIKLALTVAWRRNWRRVTYDLHRAGGFWTLAFLVVTALTGAGLVFYETAGHVMDWITWSHTSRPVPPPSVVLPGEEPVSLEAALLAARTALPGAEPVFMYPAQTPDGTIVVRMRMPGELHPNGRSMVYVDQYNGRPLLVWNALEAARGERLLNTFYPIHIGHYGGLPVRILYVLLGLAPAGLAITGFVLWRARRKAPCRDLPAAVEAGLQRKRALAANGEPFPPAVPPGDGQPVRHARPQAMNRL